MKKIRWFIYITGAIGFIVMLIFAVRGDFKANEKFCGFSFSGKIEEIVLDIKNYYYVKIEDDTTYYLGTWVKYELVQIEVGDTITKRKDCYKVFLRKKGVDYDISESPLRNCPCENK